MINRCGSYKCNPVGLTNTQFNLIFSFNVIALLLKINKKDTVLGQLKVRCNPLIAKLINTYNVNLNFYFRSVASVTSSKVSLVKPSALDK